MALSHAILTALLDQELTGYQLAKQFDVSLGFFWQASHQQIYQQLKSLNESGFISSRGVQQSGKPDKKIYALTAEGRSHLEDWVAGETKRKPPKDDLLVKLYNLGSVDPAILIEALQVRRSEHEARLALYEKIRQRGYAEPDLLEAAALGKYLALRAGMRQEQTYIEWCDEAIEILQSTA